MFGPGVKVQCSHVSESTACSLLEGESGLFTRASKVKFKAVRMAGIPAVIVDQEGEAVSEEL